MAVIVWLCALTVTAIILLVYRHLTRNFDHWRKLGVPYLQPIPVFGNIFPVTAFKQSLAQFAKDVYNYTDSRFTGFFVFDQPFLLVRDVDIIKSILITDFQHFENRSVTENPRDDKFGSKLLFVIKAPAWKLIRTKLTQAFTSHKMKCMLHLMLEASEDLKRYINEAMLSTHGLIESKEMCMKYSIDVISSCALGINSHSLKYQDTKIGAAAHKFFDITNIYKTIQIASHFMAPCLVRLWRMKFMEPTAAKFMSSVFLKQMQERAESNTKRGDLIDILLRMKDTTDDILDEDVLVAQALQFFVAGTDTIGNAVAFTLYELASNKEFQERLRDEIRSTLEKHGEISYEAIMDMKYLDNVVSETLRKYPPITFLERRCTKQYKIPNSDVTIQKGIPIYISLLGLHMDPKYFPEPEKYNPDRFSGENKTSILPFTYMPFGEGPRNCIASRFGLLSAKVGLITIILNFEVELHSTTPVPLLMDPKRVFIISPDGGVINLNFKRCAK